MGYSLCTYDTTKSPPHRDVIGLGNVNGLNAISSTLTSKNIQRSIQHELTHNLGGSHKTCTYGQKCVLKGDFNFWCDACSQAIRNNYDN